MHIVGFILGALGVSAAVALVAHLAGFTGWPAVGFGAACFVLAQLLYVLWLAGMARAEARRRKLMDGSTDAASAKPNGGVAQKG